MSSQRGNELLQAAMEAARDGDREGARRLLRQLLETDPGNVKALMLLYRVSDAVSEKRAALNEILNIDPGNLKAQEALDKLEARSLAADDEEVAPGISRRQLMLIIGGLVLVAVVLLGGASLIITANNNARRDEFNTATAIIVQQTEIAALETGSIQTITQIGIDATATFFAINSPTPTPTNTRVGPPTLPPEFTPTFTPLPFMTPTNLAPPSDAAGVIIGYGGPNELNDGYYPIVLMDVNNITVPRRITTSSEDRGLYPTALNSGRIVYSRYSRQTFEVSLIGMDGDGGNIEYLTDRWRSTSQGLLLSPDQANLSPDGSRIVFIANASNLRDQIFIVDLNDNDGDPLTRVVTDEYDYSFPAFSPDGNQIIVVRSNPDPNNPGTDLFQITLATGELRPITTDGNAMIETMPRYSPDGRELAYAAKNSEDGLNDIYIRTSDGSGQALNITNLDRADERNPVYSPDGRHLAFASNRAGGYNVYIFDRSNGALFQITGGRDSYFPGVWVPN